MNPSKPLRLPGVQGMGYRGRFRPETARGTPKKKGIASGFPAKLHAITDDVLSLQRKRQR